MWPNEIGALSDKVCQKYQVGITFHRGGYWDPTRLAPPAGAGLRAPGSAELEEAGGLWWSFPELLVTTERTTDLTAWRQVRVSPNSVSSDVKKKKIPLRFPGQKKTTKKHTFPDDMKSFGQWTALS